MLKDETCLAEYKRQKAGIIYPDIYEANLRNEATQTASASVKGETKAVIAKKTVHSFTIQEVTVHQICMTFCVLMGTFMIKKCQTNVVS